MGTEQPTFAAKLAAENGAMRARPSGRSAPQSGASYAACCNQALDVDLFRDFQGVIHLNAEVPDRAFEPMDFST
jgi:hypothetical protein